MPVRLALAPCSWPCSFMLTWRVISPCTAGPDSPHSASSGTASHTAVPVEAAPVAASPTAPNSRPTTTALGLPKRFT